MDEKIIELLFARNEKGLNIISKQYGSYCFNIANNILNNHQDSEECVNETYLKIWNSIPPDKPLNIKAYIAKIVRNISIDRLKYNLANKRKSNNTAFSELENCLSDCGEPCDGIILEELQNSMNDFLGTLKKQDRDIFVRRFFFGETIECISENYRMIPNTISKSLSRTKEKLKKHLKKEGFYI